MSQKRGIIIAGGIAASNVHTFLSSVENENKLAIIKAAIGINNSFMEVAAALSLRDLLIYLGDSEIPTVSIIRGVVKWDKELKNISNIGGKSESEKPKKIIITETNHAIKGGNLTRS